MSPRGVRSRLNWIGQCPRLYPNGHRPIVSSARSPVRRRRPLAGRSNRTSPRRRSSVARTMSYPSASLVNAAQPGSAAGETGTADHHNDPRTPSYVYRVACATQAPLIWCSGPSETVTVRAAPNSMTNIDNMKKSRPTVRFLRAFLRFLHLAIVPAPFGLRGQARRTSTPRSPPKCLPKPSATLSWDL